jgi:hypothetical protein
VIKIESFFTSGDAKFTQIRPFSFSMGDNQFWKAKVSMSFVNSEMEISMTSVTFVTCDGTNIYCVLSNGSANEKDGKAQLFHPVCCRLKEMM